MKYRECLNEMDASVGGTASQNCRRADMVPVDAHNAKICLDSSGLDSVLLTECITVHLGATSQISVGGRGGERGGGLLRPVIYAAVGPLFLTCNTR
jgi:hypothetical protein